MVPQLWKTVWQFLKKSQTELSCMWAVLSHPVVSNSLQPHWLYSPPGSSIHGDSPGKNTGVGYHALLKGICQTQGSNPGLPLQADSLLSEPPGKHDPIIPLWVYSSQSWRQISKTYVYICVHSSIIHNSKKHGSNPNSLWWRDKWTNKMWYTCTMDIILP